MRRLTLIFAGFLALLFVGLASPAAIRGDFSQKAMMRPCTTIVTTITQGTTTIVSTVTQTIHDTTTVTVTNGTTTAPPPPPSCSSLPYCGDYETANFSQWDLNQWATNPNIAESQKHNYGNGDAQIITSPVHEGSYAGKFIVMPNAGTTLQNANDRAEAVASQAQTGGFPGQEWYYGWWTYFPGPTQDWWHAGGDWNAFTQFQNTDNSGGAFGLGLDATADQFHPQIFTSGSQINKRYLGALQYDHWYHWVWHFKYSTDPTVGLVQMWMDGVEVIPLEHRATLKNTTNSQYGTAPGMYYSQGIYRGTYTSTNTVYHDGFCRAATFAAAAAC